jgi:amphi-Trp domain-containing protein
MPEENEIEVEKSYTNRENAAKLRRLADALENGKAFEIQIAGNRIYVPASAEIEFEYERDGDEQQIEIEINWKKS